MLEVPEVMEAAARVERKLAPRVEWVSVGERLDEQMRERLLEFARRVV